MSRSGTGVAVAAAGVGVAGCGVGVGSPGTKVGVAVAADRGVLVGAGVAVGSLPQAAKTNAPIINTDVAHMGRIRDFTNFSFIWRKCGVTLSMSTYKR